MHAMVSGVNPRPPFLRNHGDEEGGARVHAHSYTHTHTRTHLRATTSRGASSMRSGSYLVMKRRPFLSSSTPPSPRTASVMRKVRPAGGRAGHAVVSGAHPRPTFLHVAAAMSAGGEARAV